MRTLASINGHPIHPMLVVYPFAFLTGALGFRIAGAASKSPALTSVSQHLVPAGLGMGLLAALPGFIDYRASVPPHSSGKRRAAAHALLNIASLGLFAASWYLGRSGQRHRQTFLCQVLGSTLMSVAGYMGGTLVSRNQIGVDHRYANAGTWREERRPAFDAGQLADAAAPLELNQMKLVHFNTTRVAVARTERGPAAFEDRCTHKGGPLSDGVLICGIVQCPWHGSQFDTETGDVKCGPATEPIAVYAVKRATRPA